MRTPPSAPMAGPSGDAGVVVMADTPVPAGSYTFSCTGNCDLGTPTTVADIRSNHTTALPAEKPPSSPSPLKPITFFSASKTPTAE